MNNTTGTIYRFTIWGESHGPAVGVTIEGIPAGTGIDLNELQALLDRRRPGQNELSSARKEADRPEFTAGVRSLAFSGCDRSPQGDDKTATGNARTLVVCGSPVTAQIRNTDTRSTDYEELRFVPRPGHADFTAMVRFGEERDHAGGGQFSGRMTAPLCIAGGIALQILEKRGIRISARPVRIGGETDPEKMREAIAAAKAEGDSVGGVVECVIEGMPAGIGEPMFDGIENRIAGTVFGIPAVKGIEFGAGFAAAERKGSENNDAFTAESGPAGTGGNKGTDADVLSHIRTRTNHHGGALGGLSSGMPIVFRVAFKPTPSIAKEQDSVDIRTGEPVKLRVRGRHDPCIVPRAVPVVEAAAAAAVYDLLRIRESGKGELPPAQLREQENGISLEELRERIDAADDRILRALEDRMDISAGIAAYKAAHGLAVRDAGREREKLADIAAKSREDLQEYMQELYSLVMRQSRDYQAEHMDRQGPSD